MKIAKPSATSQSESVVRWLFLRIMPGVALGAIVAAMLVLMRNHRPASLRNFAIAASAIFSVFSIIYFYWASCATNSGGYRWSKLERFGLSASGVAALLMAIKIGFPDLVPGPTLAYFIGALLLAFVIRPLLDSAGFKKAHSKQAVNSNPH